MVKGEEVTILHVWGSFKGDYPLFNHIVRGLGNGYRHIVCYLTGPPSDKEMLAKEGFDVRWLPFSRDDLRSFRYGVVRELDRVIKTEKVDILHPQRHKATFYATLAARKNTKVRLVTTVHGLNRSRSLFRKIANRLLWPRINKIISVSAAVKRDILRANPWLPETRVEVVYNGIDLATFSRNDLEKEENRVFFGLPSRCRLWGAVGRLAPAKGHDVLLRAWAAGELGKHGGHLAIAGDGELADELSSLTRQLGIENEISLLGHVTDIPKFLNALDGFVMPSRPFHEGLPLAILEALAVGLPVVASDVSGIPEILAPLDKNGQGFLVSPENDEELGAAMKQVMAWDHNLRSKAVDAIRQHAKSFDRRHMIAHMDSLYHDVMQRAL